ncbi:MAG: hypothetical protein WCE90_02540 [Candidatus Zixiibacteriota bacterium]
MFNQDIEKGNHLTFFGKKLNFSVDKVKKVVYIGFEEGKKPTLSIKSD